MKHPIINNYDSVCRDTYVNTNIGASNLSIVQTGGYPLSVMPIGQLSVDKSGKHIDTEFEPKLKKYTIEQSVTGDLEVLYTDGSPSGSKTYRTEKRELSHDGTFLKQITANEDIVSYSSWYSSAAVSFSNGEAVVNSSNNETFIWQYLVDDVVGQEIIITFTVSEYTSGTVTQATSVNTQNPEKYSAVGTYSWNTIPNENRVSLYGQSFKGKITNINARLISEQNKLYIDGEEQIYDIAPLDPNTTIKLNNIAVIGYPDELTQLDSPFKVFSTLPASDVLFIPITTHPDWTNMTGTGEVGAATSDTGVVSFREGTIPDQAVQYTSTIYTDVKMTFDLLFRGENATTASFICVVRIIDEENWIGLRTYQGKIQVYEKVSGAFNLLGEIANPILGTNIGIKVVGDTVYNIKNGVETSFGTTRILSAGPVGLIARGWDEGPTNVGRNYLVEAI